MLLTNRTVTHSPRRGCGLPQQRVAGGVIGSSRRTGFYEDDDKEESRRLEWGLETYQCNAGVFALQTPVIGVGLMLVLLCETDTRISDRYINRD